jgi:hypothetical protein
VPFALPARNQFADSAHRLQCIKRDPDGAAPTLTTPPGRAVLELSGRQVGLMANADLSGPAITLK